MLTNSLGELKGKQHPGIWVEHPRIHPTLALIHQGSFCLRLITEPCWKPGAAQPLTPGKLEKELITTVEEYVRLRSCRHHHYSSISGNQRMNTWWLLHWKHVSITIIKSFKNKSPAIEFLRKETCFPTTLQHSRTSRRCPMPHFSFQIRWKTYIGEKISCFQNSSFKISSGNVLTSNLSDQEHKLKGEKTQNIQFTILSGCSNMYFYQ